MIDENNTDENERFTQDSNDTVKQEAPALSLVINGQYTKDLSFEAPNTPEVFNLLQSEMPNIQVDIDVQGNAKDQNIFEVVLKVRAEAKVKEELAYICELSYAGIFTINVPTENIGPVLLIDCPLILFPFLRRIVADVTSDGGFAPLMLTPVDFASLYQQRILQNQDKNTPSPD
ncbi:MAG: protein-export chaperone SecB [Rhodospirillaceae bacterium]|nr:protein-export chaperone SecB [Rhodospirillaceae bacterium]